MNLILSSVTFKEIMIITFKIMICVSKFRYKHVNTMKNKVFIM